MHNVNMLLLASLTVSQFKAFKKALAVLYRAGLTSDVAIGILCDAHRERIQQRHDYPQAFAK